MTDLIKELLTCDALLTHPKVVEAAKGLGVLIGPWEHDYTKTEGKNNTGPLFICTKCGHKNWTEALLQPCPKVSSIPGPIEKVAFDMRDACDKNEWIGNMRLISSYLMGVELLSCGPAKHWVIAATIAWQKGQNHDV